MARRAGVVGLASCLTAGIAAHRLTSTAFGGLDVDFRLSPEQPDFSREGVHAERGAGEYLAVSAIAEQGLVRLELGFEGDVSTVTTPVNFHDAIPWGRIVHV
jgi:hypothetical protein